MTVQLENVPIGFWQRGQMSRWRCPALPTARTTMLSSSSALLMGASQWGHMQLSTAAMLDLLELMLWRILQGPGA